MAILFMTTSFTGAYFSDTVAVSGNSFETGSWGVPPSTPARMVVNEVYYDVDASHGTTEPDYEWVELYNAGGNPENIKNWSITDNSNTRIITANDLSVAPGEFVLISKTNNTWNYWGIDPNSPPAGVHIVALNYSIGGGLSNTEDKLILKNSTVVPVDQISYGTDTSILNPSIPDVSAGHSISRSPNGQDTDSKNDFINLSSPTPGS